MTPSEEILFWKQKAQRMEAKIQDLEAENQALGRLTSAGQVVPLGGHGRENVAFHRPPDRNQTRPTPEPPQRNTYGAYEGRENSQGNPPPLSQPLRRSGFNELTFVVDTPQSQPGLVTLKVDKVGMFLATGPRTNEDWRKRRQDLGLSEPRSVIQTFFQFINRTAFSITPPSEIRDESSKVEDLLQRYQDFVQNLCENRDRVQQVTDFAILLLVCLCRMARVAKKIPTKTVNSYMNNLLPQNRTHTRGHNYLTRLRTSVLWPVRQAEGLRSWLGNRADEFLLLYGAPIETYRQLWDDSPLDGTSEDGRKRNEEFKHKLRKRCDFGAEQVEGDLVNGAFDTDMTEKELEASVHNIFSKLQCISGFYHLPTKGQDAPSGQGDHESTESAPNHKGIQSLVHNFHGLARQLTSLLVPEPRETSTKRPRQLGTDQIGTGLLYHHSSSEVPNANHQRESGLQSDETVAQLVHNPPSGIGIATIHGGLSIGNQETAISQGASVLRFTPGSRNMQVFHPEETTLQRQKRYGDGSPVDGASEKRPRGGGNGASQDGGQATSLPANGSAASSSLPTLRAHQSNDDHSDSRSNEDQSDRSSEGQFDDQTAGEAAPTRPRKRQRRSNSRGPPHSLLTPPTSQPLTHALNGTFHPQFGQSSSSGIALHQSVPTNAHTVTDRSPDIQFTAKGPRDRSPLDRERRGGNGAGLHPGNPIHVTSPPAPQTKGIIAGLTLPELSGTVEQQLAALINFGSVHWPLDDFAQFQPGEMITGHILDELLRLELKQFSNYSLGIPS